MTIAYNAFLYASYSLLFLTMVSPLFHLISILIRPKKMAQRMFPMEKPQQGMTILIPCYNEMAILQTTIEALKKVDYDNYEVIFINDNSKDSTMQALNILLDLCPSAIRHDKKIDHEEVRGFYGSKKHSNIFVIDKENGGKADSLNSAIAYASHELIITLDADTILDKDSLRIINQRFDKKIIAGGGNVRILQGFCGSKFSFNLKYIVRFQIIEYMKGFGILRQSLANANALIVISGAFGIFRRSILMEVGGYRNTIGEDIDITLKFQSYISDHPDCKMIYIPEAICYTECPEKWKDLYQQRIRWQKAFMDCIVRYRYMLAKTVFKKPFSFFMVFDALVVGTITSYIATACLISLLFVPITKASILLLIYSTFINLTWSVSALIISHKSGHTYGPKDTYRIMVTIVLELLIFNIVRCVYVMLGSVLYFFNRHGWNKFERTGNLYQIEQQKRSEAQ